MENTKAKDGDRLISVKVRAETHHKLKVLAAHKGISMVQILDDAVEEAQRRHDRARR